VRLHLIAVGVAVAVVVLLLVAGAGLSVATLIVGGTRVVLPALLLLVAVELWRIRRQLVDMLTFIEGLHQRVSALEDLERELHRHLTARVRLELTKLLRDSQARPPAWFVAHDQTRES